jgi:hypothetical protein
MLSTGSLYPFMDLFMVASIPFPSMPKYPLVPVIYDAWHGKIYPRIMN